MKKRTLEELADTLIVGIPIWAVIMAIIGINVSSVTGDVKLGAFAFMFSASLYVCLIKVLKALSHSHELTKRSVKEE